MNRDAGITLAMALLAVGALGVAATTFESATSTDADDVIDLDYDRLPIGQDDAAAIQREMNAGESDGSEGAAGRSDPDAPSGTGPADDRSDAASSAGADEAATDPERGGDTRDSSGGAPESSAGSSGSDGADGGGASDSPGETPGQLSLLWRLLSLLAALVPYLLLVAALLAAAWVVARHGDRLRALLDREDADESRASAADDWLDGSPSNAVDRAWVGMVRGLDLDGPAAMTPAECAAAAVRAGFDPEAVHALTEAFEEVRYGGTPMTESHRRVARRSRRRLDVASDAGDGGGPGA